MQTRRWTRFVLPAPMLCSLAALASAQQPVTATIDATRTAPAITKLVFGGFMEPATTGVWAEMLADRKFFAEITSKPVTDADRRLRPPRSAAPLAAGRSRRVRHDESQHAVRRRVEPAGHARGDDAPRYQPGRPRAEGRARLHGARAACRDTWRQGQCQLGVGTEPRLTARRSSVPALTASTRRSR